MDRDAHIQTITDMLHRCSDPDLLDLIYKILLQESGHQAVEVF